MIFTAFSRLGDFMLTWPVASWYYKTHGEKIHWVLPKPLENEEHSNYNLYLEKYNLFKIKNLLECQDFTEKVTYIPITERWQFNPEKYGIEGKYCNFGIWWTREFDYIPGVYGKRYGLGFDKDFVIKYKKIECPTYNDVWIETAVWRDNVGSLRKIIPPDSHELNHNDDIEYNINISMNAKNVWTNGGGFAIMMDLLKKPIIIHKTKFEFELGDKPVFRCLAFPNEGYPEHTYIWQ